MNAKLEYQWPNNEYGILLSYIENIGDEVFDQPYILPKEDGGAFFAYEYSKYLRHETIVKSGRKHSSFPL